MARTRVFLLVLVLACDDQVSEVVAPIETRVYVTVYTSKHEPAVNAHVLIHHPEGTLLAHLNTDENGNTDYELDSVAMVTSVEVVGSDAVFSTVAGVEPGQHLVFGSPDSFTFPEDAGADARVVMPGEVAGATEYSVAIGYELISTPNPLPAVRIPISTSCAAKQNAFGERSQAWTASRT